MIVSGVDGFDPGDGWILLHIASAVELFVLKLRSRLKD